jgi:cytochrome c-type biogenesis protein CcmH
MISLISRRSFLLRGAAVSASLVAVDRLIAQGASPQSNASNLGAMDQAAAQSVRRPAKPNARPQLSVAQRDDLEHHIRCQCGCTLDVYTCRTTDFSCQVSPAMHADVQSLVDGGYSAQEILDSFTDVYGERVLMAPRPQGFNLLGYAAPFIALVAGGVAVVAVLRAWRGKPQTATSGTSLAATPDELARLDAAIRDDR